VVPTRRWAGLLTRLSGPRAGRGVDIAASRGRRPRRSRGQGKRGGARGRAGGTTPVTADVTVTSATSPPSDFYFS
jgi:hypothetical protein